MLKQTNSQIENIHQLETLGVTTEHWSQLILGDYDTIEPTRLIDFHWKLSDAWVN